MSNYSFCRVKKYKPFIYDKEKRHFHFNHIDPTINKEKLSEIKALYKLSHKRFWSYKMAFKYFKRLNLAINIGSTSLGVIGTNTGGIALNPVVLGTISGAGVVFKTFSEIKSYKRKIEMCTVNLHYIPEDIDGFTGLSARWRIPLVFHYKMSIHYILFCIHHESLYNSF